MAVWPFRRGPRFPLPRLRPGRWGGAEVFLVFFAYNLLPALFILPSLDRLGIFENEFKYFYASPLIFCFLLALNSLLLFMMSQTRWNDVGWSTARWANNLVLG